VAERAVLVTRPGHQAQGLCRLVREAGFKPIAQPMIEIRPLPVLPPAQLQMVIDLDQYQHVIMVSSNAIQWGMEWISRYWPQLPQGLSWYTVGAASAEKLAAWGIAVKQPQTEMNSEGLLALPALLSVAGERVLIVKGEGGRTQLRDVLTERGARVEQLCVYQRILPSLTGAELATTLNENTFAALVITSGEGLHNMLSLLPGNEQSSLREIPLIVPGQRVAKLAEDRGFRSVYTARNATDKAIIETLCACVGSVDNGG
jgi:uroporphyrinogen-III synthase